MSDLIFEILWHAISSHKAIDIEHSFSILTYNSIESTDNATNPVNSISKRPATKHHGDHNPGSFDFSLRRNLSVTYCTHCGKRPVHTGNVLFPEAPIYNAICPYPAILFRSDLFKAYIVE